MTKENLAKSIYEALSVSQDVKIPYGPVLIDRELLQSIRDLLAYEAWDKAHSGCEDLKKQLDSIYPFLKQQ